jgi:hypothetical protein
MRRADRLARIERRFGPLPPPGEAELHELPKYLSFAECEAAQRAMVHHGCDALAAVEASDPMMVLLLAVGRARAAGIAVPEVVRDDGPDLSRLSAQELVQAYREMVAPARDAATRVRATPRNPAVAGQCEALHNSRRESTT